MHFSRFPRSIRLQSSSPREPHKTFLFPISSSLHLLRPEPQQPPPSLSFSIFCNHPLPHRPIASATSHLSISIISLPDLPSPPFSVIFHLLQPSSPSQTHSLRPSATSHLSISISIISLPDLPSPPPSQPQKIIEPERGAACIATNFSIYIRAE
uniref:Uncharacterized protein n=1 Tax=Populus davidiana TaxID=266767 RepID=A0A6M2EKU8_9ROSI